MHKSVPFEGWRDSESRIRAQAARNSIFGAVRRLSVSESDRGEHRRRLWSQTATASRAEGTPRANRGGEILDRPSPSDDDRTVNANDVFDAIADEPDENQRWERLTSLVKADPAGARQAASAAIEADEPRRREAAADVLGQVSTVERDAAYLIADALRPRLAVEKEPAVLASLIYAIGHTYDRAARGGVLEHARHPDENVRFAVAQSLPVLGLDESALTVLRELSADSDSDVRDWATFGLAESEANDPATIEALAARAEDTDDDTRAEAIMGLARRKDPRARSLIERELARPVHGSLMGQALEELEA